MTTSPVVHIRARITPWDDQAFVRAFEAARDDVQAHSEHADGPQAAAQVQHRLREAGYPEARIDVVRTVAESLEHTSHWLVTRDG